MSSDKSPPEAQLKLEWVYGYRGHQCRQNLFYLTKNEIVYFVAGVAIVMNLKQHTQRFFMGHTDDIISLVVHPSMKVVATGQVGKEHPTICIWNVQTMETMAILKDQHKKGVCGLSFSRDGKLLASVGLEDAHNVVVWNWQKGQAIASCAGHSDRIFDVQFNPHDDSIVTAGVKHLKFWSLSGNTLTGKKAPFTGGETQTCLSVAFGEGGAVYAGALNGDVYKWQGDKMVGAIPQAHAGAVFALFACPEGFASGDKEGVVRLWDPEFKPIASVNVSKEIAGASIRSVCWLADRVIVGTRDSEIVEIAIATKKHRLVSQGHASGELWGLATHPRKGVFCTASDDMTVRLWDTGTNECMVSKRLRVEARSVAFAASGAHLAVGCMDGSVRVLQTKDLHETAKVKAREKMIGELKYSPDGDFLAAGSNDGFVDVFDARSDYKHVGQCAVGALVVHLDWSEDGKFVQVNTGDFQLRYFSMPKGKEVPAADIKRAKWATWTSVLGGEVEGIWGKYAQKDDVNATHTCRDVLVCGDDFGRVKLLRFPSPRPGAKARAYRGHSAHVTCTRFTHDHLRVITTGGADQSVFQWVYLPEGGQPVDGLNGELVDEESDSDLSDVEEWDSDIEAEMNIDYEREIGREELADLKEERKKERVLAEKRGENVASSGDDVRSKAPKDGLRLEFVHGYRGFDTRNNIYYTASGEIAYHAAGVGIVYDPRNHTQRFYLGHTDDILCLDMHPSQTIVATGQIGKQPSVHVWDTDKCEVISILKGTHTRGICCADFSPDGKRLCTVGVDDDHTIAIWNWKKGEMLANVKGHKDKIFVAKWNHYADNQLISAGIKHIKFWTVAGGGLTSKRGTFGDVGKLDTMLCVEYNEDGDAFSGCQNGLVYRWNDNVLVSTVEAHKGPVFGIHQCEGGFATGGKDGVIRLWDHKFKPISQVTVELDTVKVPCIRAVCWIKGRLVAGTKTGQIVEVGQKTGKTNVLVESHAEGQLWGLDTHPSKDMFVTCSDDLTLRVWDLRHEKLVNFKPLKKAARCCGFSPDGKFVAVGYVDGSFAVLDGKTLKEVAKWHHRKEAISDIKFSPNGKYLAVGSNDNFVDIYNTIENKRVGVCKGASSYITHVDWARDSKLLQVNSGAREHLFFEAPRGKRKAINSDVYTKIDWNENTSVLGKTVEGIWPKMSDVTDVNAAHLTNDGKTLATGDDFGFVKLFDHPVVGKHAKHKKYVGHSAHVANVRWTYDDSFLVSAGGADTTVMVWRHAQTTAKAGDGGGESADSDTDTDDEGGYDADVDKERRRDYDAGKASLRKTSAVKPHMRGAAGAAGAGEEGGDEGFSRQIDNTVKVKKHELPQASSRAASPTRKGRDAQQPPVVDLQLDYVLGYRGFDTHANLFYTAAGDVVFHTAGAGVVLNAQERKQTFYLEHTDDIVSLALHPSGDIVATGQLGKKPTVNVWDVKTKQTLSLMQGDHTRGVCCLAFSPDGKNVASVGLDDSHTIVVYKWKSGTKLAAAKGHTDKIFVCQYRPDDANKFVTAGVKHIKFWTLAGSELVSKRGIFGKEGKIQTMLSVGFAPDGVTFSGAQDGSICMWQDVTCVKTFEKAHDGAVFGMFTSAAGIVSGGKDGVVKVWEPDMKKAKSVVLGNSYKVRALCAVKGRILVGTQCGEVLEASDKTGAVDVLVGGHGEGELWGLATHPGKSQFATCSDDKSVRLWDAKNHSCMQRKTLKQAARSCAFSPDGTLLAVGFKDGSFTVLQVPTLAEVASKRDRKEAIHDLRFSPDGKMLAVGSNDNFVDFYKNERDLPRTGFARGMSSFVTHLDWSEDSRVVQVNTGDYAHLHYESPSGKQVSKRDVLSKLTWDSWTSVLGKDVLGIWPKGADKTDVNAVDLDKSNTALATGDDFGFVKLFEFPCPEKHSKHKKYPGHSAHVTNVRFSYDNKFLVSTGGLDASIFMWRTVTK